MVGRHCLPTGTRINLSDLVLIRKDCLEALLGSKLIEIRVQLFFVGLTKSTSDSATEGDMATVHQSSLVCPSILKLVVTAKYFQTVCHEIRG